LSVGEGIRVGKTVITTDSAAMIASPGIDVILEITGNPAAGIRHALLVRSVGFSDQKYYF
jgi:predicted homoserine dehydrogenase-like protein